MKRLHFLVEGPTEREFIENVLAPHLYGFDKICDARLITTSRDWSGGVFYNGGVTSYEKLRFEIQSQIAVDHNSDSYFTTMLDYYGLPKDFPGVAIPANGGGARQAVQAIEVLFEGDILSLFPALNFVGHFLPNILCHEFESLIFAAPDQLLNYYPTRQVEVQNLQQQLIACGGDPELVNNSRVTAPSKRILSEIGEYDKVTAGALVAMDIGLDALRQKCSHFDAWISKLEKL